MSVSASFPLESSSQAAADLSQSFAMAGVLTNSSTTLASALSGTTRQLTAGDYRIDVSYGWNVANPASELIAELTVNGTSIVGGWGGAMHRSRPIASGGGNVSATHTNQSYPFSRSFIVSLPDGTSSFDLSFASSAAGDRCALFDPSVTITKTTR